MAAIIFTKKILNTRSPKLHLLGGLAIHQTHVLGRRFHFAVILYEEVNLNEKETMTEH